MIGKFVRSINNLIRPSCDHAPRRAHAHRAISSTTSNRKARIHELHPDRSVPAGAGQVHLRDQGHFRHGPGLWPRLPHLAGDLRRHRRGPDRELDPQAHRRIRPRRGRPRRRRPRGDGAGGHRRFHGFFGHPRRKRPVAPARGIGPARHRVYLPGRGAHRRGGEAGPEEAGQEHRPGQSPRHPGSRRRAGRRGGLRHRPDQGRGVVLDAAAPPR